MIFGQDRAGSWYDLSRGCESDVKGFRSPRVGTMPADPVSRPWRRFLRFSVRGMIVLVLVVGGWLGWIVRSARIQREAVAAIEKAGGEVEYGSGSTKTPTLKTHELWAPKWAVDALGVDYFGHVCEVTLTLNCTDRELADVGRLTALDSLRLYYPNVSDAGLVQLQGLTKLSKLVLSQTQISDAGLAHLKPLSNLSELNLYSTPITDAGLGHLTTLNKLSKLSLRGTKVTDAGLVSLKGLTDLSQLDLGRTRISDAGLAHLNGLGNLTDLDLSDTSITDAGLTHVKRLTNLTKLDLMHTDVSDAGLAELGTLTRLSWLRLGRHSRHRSWSERTSAGSAEPEDLSMICRPSNRTGIVPLVSPGVGTSDLSTIPEIAPSRIY